MSDLISRQAVIEAMDDFILDEITNMLGDSVREILEGLPSAQPEPKPISYMNCSNAMLKMWIDNVLTDGEYNRIMDKLNAHELSKREKNDG